MNCTLVEELTPGEIAAAGAYASEATYFHAIAQGRQEELAPLKAFQDFLPTVPQHVRGLDAAIRKCTLDHDAVLYSGHGFGLAIRGSLEGDPGAFKGLRYRYPGFISTSSVEAVAINSFLIKRTFVGSKPTLLEFRLPAGYQVLDMALVLAKGEFEYLIGRGRAFTIVDASSFRHPKVKDPILRLVLEPSET